MSSSHPSSNSSLAPAPAPTTSRSPPSHPAISHRAFLYPQIPRTARDALAAQALAGNDIVSRQETSPSGPSGPSGRESVSSLPPITKSMDEKRSVRSGLGRSPSGSSTITREESRRSNSLSRRHIQPTGTSSNDERSIPSYGRSAVSPFFHPHPPTQSTEALPSHSQDVWVHPSLFSAPSTAGPSPTVSDSRIGGERGDEGFDHPLSAGGHGDDDFNGAGGEGKQRSGYVVASPKDDQTFLEDQWRGDGNGDGREHGERTYGDEMKRHPFANGNGNQTDGYQTDESNINRYRLDSLPIPPPKYFPTPQHQPILHRNADLLNRLPLQSTTYYFNGLLQTGGDSPLPLIGSIILVLGLGGLWLGTTGVWMWRDGLGGGGPGVGGKVAVVIFGYLLGIVASSMMMTAFRDPGIIPRNLDLTPPTSQDGDADTPLTRDIRIRGGVVTVKYCETCKIYRAPRSSHCRLCGNCVEGIDHHCTYLHTCVGRRNYTTFITFLVSVTLATIYAVVFSALHYSILCSREGISFKQALARSPESAVSFAIGVVVVWPVMALLGYHLRLMVLNSTTIEQIRHSVAKSLVSDSSHQANPFSYGSFWRNIAHSLCRPRYPSWVDAHGFTEEDLRQPNPGEKGVFGIASKVDLRGSDKFGSTNSRGTERKDDF